jgi:recombination DNA repair RAD52 pathway protein
MLAAYFDIKQSAAPAALPTYIKGAKQARESKPKRRTQKKAERQGNGRQEKGRQEKGRQEKGRQEKEVEAYQTGPVHAQFTPLSSSCSDTEAQSDLGSSHRASASDAWEQESEEHSLANSQDWQQEDDNDVSDRGSVFGAEEAEEAYGESPGSTRPQVTITRPWVAARVEHRLRKRQPKTSATPVYSGHELWYDEDNNDDFCDDDDEI